MSILGFGALLIGAWAGAAETIPLAGTWRFEIVQPGEQPFSRDLAGQIRLPGTIDDAGLGPKNDKPPSLEGPYRLYDYTGPAWYQRDIDIPAAWAGKHITLLLERCRWVTTVWLDDKRIGSQDSLIAPHVHELGTGVAPGKHRLTICVDNTVKLNLGKFVSALFGGTWGNMNGIVGTIELQARPKLRLDPPRIFPRTDGTARVEIMLRNSFATPVTGIVAVEVREKDTGRIVGKSQKDFSIPTGISTEGREILYPYYPLTLSVQLDRPPKLWSEFSPALYEVQTTVTVPQPAISDSNTAVFGFREFAAKGTQFTMNGRPVFLRGTLECSVWPLTGYPPTDVPAWQRIYRIMKSYGLNHIRFHSWCPPDAAFAAADIEGIMVQAEGPQANVPAGADPARDAFIEAEFQRIVDTYGNHPSFCTMALGNEYGGDESLLTRWVEMLIRRDSRHLYTSASNNRQRTANRQFTVTPQGRGIPGAGTDRDLRDIVAGDPHPVLGHEIGQWMYFPDFNEMKKYRGVLAVRNFELIRDDLANKHLLDLAPQYVQASGRFATLLYKEEIEVLLRTPGYAGFALLDLHDYPTQGTALIGPLDPFWDSKGFIAPEAFRRFCGPTVPLVRMPRRTYTADEPFQATVDVSHFGAADIAGARPTWKITNSEGREVASGRLPTADLPTGKLTSLGQFKASLAKAAAPTKLTVTVSLEGTGFSNDWEIWVYPAKVDPHPPADVVVCEKWDQAKAALADGKKVVFFAMSAAPAHSMRGRFLPVFWSPVWFPSQKPNTMGLLLDPKHPLLAQFPSEFHSNWQWHELMQNSRLIVLDDTPAAYRPTVQVIDNFARNHKLGLVFEGRAADGQLLVCGMDLPKLTSDPAGRQFLASLYAYVGSAAFQPKQPLSGELLEKLFAAKFTNKFLELGARVRADSAAPSYEAELAIDGSPNTIWHTPWSEPATKFPHELIIELPKPAKMAGLTCLPRQDGNRNGWIKDYAVHISSDGKYWGQPVAKGSLPRDADLHTIKFASPVESRYLRFTAANSFDPSKPFASLAELNLILAE